MSQGNNGRSKWFAIGLIVSWGLTLAGGVWWVATERQTLAQAVHAHERSLDDHEIRLRLIESRIEQIAADVRWIRYVMENGRPPLGIPE